LPTLHRNWALSSYREKTLRTGRPKTLLPRLANNLLTQCYWAVASEKELPQHSPRSDAFVTRKIFTEVVIESCLISARILSFNPQRPCATSAGENDYGFRNSNGTEQALSGIIGHPTQFASNARNPQMARAHHFRKETERRPESAA
jgi:hypothetical protein